MELKKGYEEMERTIVNSATRRGVLFEDAAKIKDKIIEEGLSGFEFIEMFKARLEENVINNEN
ncbi:MAG: hypothetical protein PHT07_22275 [Paludibacter sp.]|nr:hypothetical protein [Paludibacter sp.]